MCGSGHDSVTQGGRAARRALSGQGTCGREARRRDRRIGGRPRRLGAAQPASFRLADPERLRLRHDSRRPHGRRPDRLRDRRRPGPDVPPDGRAGAPPASARAAHLGQRHAHDAALDGLDRARRCRSARASATASSGSAARSGTTARPGASSRSSPAAGAGPAARAGRAASAARRGARASGAVRAADRRGSAAGCVRAAPTPPAPTPLPVPLPAEPLSPAAVVPQQAQQPEQPDRCSSPRSRT